MNRWSRVGIAVALLAGVLWSGGVAEAGYFVSPVTVCVDASSGVVRLVASSSKCDGGAQSWSASQPAPLLCWNASSLDPKVGTRKVSVAPSSGCTAPLRLVPVDNVSLLCADGKIGLLRWPVTGSCRAGATPIRVRSASTPTTVAITIPTTTPTTAVLVPSVSLSATLIDSGKFPKAAVVTANVAGTVYFIEGASPVNTVLDITSARFERWTSGVVAANTPTSIALDVDVLSNGYYRVFVANGQGVLSAPALNKVTISIPRISNVAITTTTTTTAPLSCAAGGVCDYGDTGPGGGVVFYVASSDFTSTGSTCNTACKYMEAATTDLSTGIVWATADGFCYKTIGDNDGNCQETSVYSGDTSARASSRTASEAIGMGMKNTEDYAGRLASYGITNFAAGIARTYTNNGKTDWHLPSKAELNELYNKRSTVGGFSSAFYWSSSEDAPTLAWTVGFDGTSYYSYAKNGTSVRVRPVRAF